MHRLWVLAACIALVYPVSAIRAQSSTDRVAIEVAAARTMLAHQYNKGSVSIDPAEGAQGHAPSHPGVGKLRPAAHTERLAKVLSASVRRYADVTSCTDGQPPCAMSGTSTHIILSAPIIVGDTASVTATIYQNSPSKRQPVDYETVLLTLVRRPGGWAVVKEDQLGIS